LIGAILRWPALVRSRQQGSMHGYEFEVLFCARLGQHSAATAQAFD
jgi:hypothetical protein